MSNTSTMQALPSDPEGMNDARAEWAKSALMHFAAETGCDYEYEARHDFMTDLIHLADREGWDFDALVAGARANYRIETESPE